MRDICHINVQLHVKFLNVIIMHCYTEMLICRKLRHQAAFLGQFQAPTVSLGTALVHVKRTVRNCKTVQTLIDSTSHISAITLACCRRLGFRPKRWNLFITELSGQKMPDVLTLQPQDFSKQFIQVKTWVLSSINSSGKGNMQSFITSQSIIWQTSCGGLTDRCWHIPSSLEWQE